MVCNNTGSPTLVFVDLEPGLSMVYTSTDGGMNWVENAIVTAPCTTGGQLIPRDAGYTLGMTKTPSGYDRILLLGGSNQESHVYYR